MSLASSRYVEDAHPSGHCSVWGSWYDVDLKVWGFACCRATKREASGCAESAPVASEAPAKAAPEPLQWRPRADFETREGFVVHASRWLAERWLKWLQELGRALLTALALGSSF